MSFWNLNQHFNTKVTTNKCLKQYNQKSSMEKGLGEFVCKNSEVKIQLIIIILIIKLIDIGKKKKNLRRLVYCPFAYPFFSNKIPKEVFLLGK